MADPLQQPALAMPPGVISEFPTRRSSDQAWYHVFVVLATVIPGTLLLIRLYTKLRIVRKVDVTDYLIVIAFLFFLAVIVCARICLGEGAGVHQWNVTVQSFIGVAFWLYIAQTFYAPAIFLIKTTLLMQYVRLFATPRVVNPFMWYSAWIIIVVTGIYFIIATAITIFACTPREANWNPLIKDAKCLDNNIGLFITCLFNITSDLIILILPARAVWSLRIPTTKKVGIVLLFAVGLLACIANAMIIIHAIRMNGDDADVTYNTAWVGLWAIAEIGFGIVVACTFSLPKFFHSKGKHIKEFYSKVTKRFATAVSIFSPMQTEKDTSSSHQLTVGQSGTSQSTTTAESERELSFINPEEHGKIDPRHEIDTKTSNMV